jgi:hypothetical protein
MVHAQFVEHVVQVSRSVMEQELIGRPAVHEDRQALGAELASGVSPGKIAGEIAATAA